MNALSLVMGNVRNDLLSREGRLALIVQLVIATFLFSLTLSSASIQAYLSGNLERLLGADLVIQDTRTLEADESAWLKRSSSQLSHSTVATVTLANGALWQNAQLKAVDSHYPIQGELRVSDALGGASRVRFDGPRAGEIWLDPRLAVALEVRVGDELSLGNSRLTVSAFLLHEPDRLMEGHSVAPRAMIAATSFASARLESGDTRHRYLLSLDAGKSQAIEQWVAKNRPTATVMKKHGGRHPLAMFWQRVENVFGLLSVVLLIFAAVALDMTNKQWRERTQHRLALQSSFGVPLRRSLAMMAGQMAMTWMVVVVVSIALAFAAHLLLLDALQGSFPGIEAAFPKMAIVQTAALLAGLLLLLQLPFLLPLLRTSISQLVRTEGSATSPMARLASGAAAVSWLAFAYTDNWLLTALVLAAAAGSIVFLIALTWISLRLAEKITSQCSGSAPFAIFMMRQRMASKTAQITGLGTSAMLLLSTLMLLGDLGKQIESHRRQHDGNLVIADASEAHLQALRKWADRTDSVIRQLRPFVHARLVTVNGHPVADHAGQPSETLAAVQSPIRLHWTESIPANNVVTSGHWWSEDNDTWQQISVEDEVLTDLGLEHGDRLGFDIDGQRLEYRLVSSHAYQSGAGSVTFWFQVPARARSIIEAETRFMGSMELPEGAWGNLSDLWSENSGLMLVPLRQLTAQFDRAADLVVDVTTVFSIFILVLTILIVLASTQAFIADDRRRNGLIQSMGLTKRDCLKIDAAEWTVTALIAGTGAIGGTLLAGHLLYQRQFGLPFTPDWRWLAATLAVMIAVLIIIGASAGARSRQTSVRDLLNY